MFVLNHRFNDILHIIIYNVLNKWRFGNEYQNFCKNMYETIMENLAVGC